jgi:multimeric flavodoxin WrbA
MKNVLILEGSARRNGNSALLSEEFARGAEEAGCRVEKLCVAAKKVAGCLGCNACYRNGGECVQKDDMAEIREKMLAADVIVLASPIYFYSMTAQMKAVIDRTYAFFPQLEGKTFYFLVTCGAPDTSFTETMLAALRGFTCCVPDAKEGGVVLGIGAMDAGDIRGSEAMAEAYALGRGIS